MRSLPLPLSEPPGGLLAREWLREERRRARAQRRCLDEREAQRRVCTQDHGFHALRLASQAWVRFQRDPRLVLVTAPTIVTVSSSSTISGNGQTASVSIPSGTQEGDLLVIGAGCIISDNTGAMSGTDCTPVATAGGSGSNAPKVGFLYKVASAGQGAITLTYASANASQRRWYCARVTGFDAANVSGATAVSFSQLAAGATHRNFESIDLAVGECLAFGVVEWLGNTDNFTQPENYSIINSAMNRFAGCSRAYTASGATGTQAGSSTTSTTYVSLHWAVRPGGGVSNTAPTVTLNTPDETEFAHNEDVILEGTPSDADGDRVHPGVEITDHHTGWQGGEEQVDGLAHTQGGGLNVHPQPTGATAWTGKRQVDDRPGQSWTSKGGRLSGFALRMARDQISPGVPYNPSGESVVREYVHAGTYGTSSAPSGALAYADRANTPVPDWAAQSDVKALDTTVLGDAGWHKYVFSGDQMRRGVNGQPRYCELDWWPDSNGSDNGFSVAGDALNGGAQDGALHSGNAYNDGVNSSESLYGVRATWDLWFQAFETFLHSTYDSIDHASMFSNTVTPADEPPFLEGQKLRLTIPAGTLPPGIYRYRMRAKDPDGTNEWGAQTSERTFTVLEPPSDDDQVSAASPAVASWVVPFAAVTAGAALSLASPVAAQWVVPPATTSAAVISQGTAVVGAWVVPSATVAAGPITAQASAVVGRWTVPTATVSSGATVAEASPVVASWVVPSAEAQSGAVTPMATPVIGAWVVPAATTTAGAATSLASPVVAAWQVPPADSLLGDSAVAQPVVAAWVVPSATVIAGAVASAAQPVIGAWVIPSAQVVAGAIASAATPVVASWVVPDATSSTAVQSAATPVVARWQVPAATTIVGAAVSQASPIVAPWVITSATVIVGGVSAAAAPVVAQWVVPAAIPAEVPDADVVTMEASIRTTVTMNSAIRRTVVVDSER